MIHRYEDRSTLGPTAPMVEPIEGPAYFDRVFVDDGALTSPNGYYLDPIGLRVETGAAGLLHRVATAK